MNPWYLVSSVGSPTLWMLLSVVMLVIYTQLKEFCWRDGERSKRIMKRFLTLFLVSILVTFGATVLLKIALGVPRNCIPCPAPGCNPYCPTDNALPSGHTATAFALFTSIYAVADRKWLLPIFIIPALVGVARVMLGVHTWLDVLAGAVLGTGMVVLMWWLEKNKLYRTKKGRK